MATLLTDEELDAATGHLPDWNRVGEGTGAKGAELVREVTLPTFPEAILVVNRVAEIAENDNHHPDIDIRWATLTFRLSTHSAGGLTQADLALANEINGVLDAVGGEATA